MKITPPVIDYRKIRFHNLTSPEFRHLWSLLYWVVYGILFILLEHINTPDRCTLVYFPLLDDRIPFLEIFVIPYLLWFVALFAIHLYTLLYDIPLYKRLIKFIIITNTTALIIFALFPNWQNLRPESFERDNILVDFMKFFYANVDTPTNVLPSLHVVDSMAVMFTILKSKRIKSRTFKGSMVVLAILISISTVFLKQHSVLDVLAAIPVCALGYVFAFTDLFKKKKTLEKQMTEAPLLTKFPIPDTQEELAVEEAKEAETLEHVG